MPQSAYDPSALQTTEITPAQRDAQTSARVRARLALAGGYYMQGQLSIALDEANHALNVSPQSVDALNLRGLILMQMGDQSAADRDFKQALNLEPLNPSVLHNFALLQCQRGQHEAAEDLLTKALAQPQYADRAKSWLTLGLCQLRAQKLTSAEHSLLESYALDATNPVTGFNLAQLMYSQRNLVKSRFYIKRVNASAWANAETLWLGIKIEHSLGEMHNIPPLASQLQKQYPQSKEFSAYERGVFNE